MRSARMILVVAVGVLAGSPVAAQQDLFPPRSGLWGGFGIGGGYGEGTGGYQAGGALVGQIGGIVNPKLAIGADLATWAWRSNGLAASASTVGGAVTFFPSPTGGFFLKGGIGFAVTVDEVNVGGQDETETNSGGGLVLSVGQDVRMGTTLFLTPAFTFMAQRIGGANLRFFLFTIGLTWR